MNPLELTAWSLGLNRALLNQSITCLSIRCLFLLSLNLHFLALKDPHWCNAMYDEHNVLVKNSTWILVPRPSCVNLVCSMWLFKHKFHDDRTLNSYEARFVANGNSQQLGVDFDKTFSLVVKLATIRHVLSLTVSHKWSIHQLDVKNAFLNGDLFETGSQIIDSLQSEFDMTDLGALNYFLGISAIRHPTGLFLSQQKYALQLLEHAHIVNCNPSRTPVDMESKLGTKGVPVQDPTLYRSLARELLYLTFTHPDLSYAGTLYFGLQLYVSATNSLVGYTDADCWDLNT
ncbi:ribonuclease H-like domain-containing protein [Tanacetum coccineum]